MFRPITPVGRYAAPQVTQTYECKDCGEEFETRQTLATHARWHCPAKQDAQSKSDTPDVGDNADADDSVDAGSSEEVVQAEDE